MTLGVGGHLRRDLITVPPWANGENEARRGEEEFSEAPMLIISRAGQSPGSCSTVRELLTTAHQLPQSSHLVKDASPPGLLVSQKQEENLPDSKHCRNSTFL